jgi:hypothetical protein
VVEGLVSSSNPESYAGGSIATSRVSQIGQIKELEPDEERYLEEGNFDKKNSSDGGSSVISNDLKRRAIDA